MAAAVMMLMAHFYGFSATLVFILYIITFFWGGELFIRGTWREAQKLYLGFNAFITVGAFGAFLFYVINNLNGMPLIKISGDILVLPMMLTLANFIKAFELKSISNSFAFIESLDNFISRSVIKIEHGHEKRVFTAEAEPDDIILVKPGERIALDAIIIKGNTLVDEYFLTGNILPTAKQKGSAVYAGSVNKGAEFTARVISLKGTSRMAKILQAVKDNERKKSITASPLEKYSAKVLLFFILIAALQLGWGVYSGGVARLPFWAAVFFMILACAGPIQYMAAVLLPLKLLKAGARRAGVRITSPQALKILAGCTKVFIDKTGTLTTGRLEISEILPAAGVKETELLKAAHISQHGSDSVFEEAFKEYFKKHKIKDEKIISAEVFPSQGSLVKAGESEYMAGRRMWLEERGINIPQDCDDPGRTSFHVAKNGKYMGCISFSDRLRANAAATVAWLKKTGKEVCLISGDNTAALQAAAKKAGISEYYANMFPQDKAAKISAQENLGEKIVMIGDGFNDILALLKADASIAFAAGAGAGGRGAFASWVDISVHSKDFAAVRRVFEFDRRLNNITSQNILIAVLLNVYTIYLILLYSRQSIEWHWLPGLILVAVLAVFLNSMRLYRI